MTKPAAAPQLRDTCAERILEVVPRAVATIRAELRALPGLGLSVAQLRGLLFVRTHPGASLGELSAYLGITAATGSVLVGRLVDGGFVRREVNPGERRRIRLDLTAQGERAAALGLQEARASLRDALEAVDDRDVERLLGALEILDRVATGRVPASVG